MLLTLLLTVFLAAAGFAAGAAGVVWIHILRPVHAAQERRDTETRTLLFAERLRLNGASYATIKAALPKTDIPTTIRKSYF